jgi:hypothetical protein
MFRDRSARELGRDREGTEDEQRQLPRFGVANDEEILALLRTSSRRVEARVADLGLGGAGLLVVESDWRGQRRGQLSLQLRGQPLGEVPVDLVHSSGPPGGLSSQVLGVRYRACPRGFLEELCRFLVVRHSQSAAHPRFLDELGHFSVNTDPLRIRQLLLHCCRRRRALRIFRNGAPAGCFHPGSLRARQIEGRLELPAGQRLQVGEALLLLHSSPTALYLLQGQVLGLEADRVLLSFPVQLLEGGARRLGRLSASERFPVTLEFLHPQLAGLAVQKKVRELGFDGLRFDLDVEQDLLAPGMLVSSAILRLPDGRSLPCRCAVRHTVQLLDGSYQCGVQITDFHGAGREIWVEQVLRQMNPEVEEATLLTLDEAWDVFDRSGYLEEKPAEYLLSMREPFLQTWRKLLRTRRSSARFWLHRSAPAQAVGTICTTRIYSNTWLVHHMGVDRSLPAVRKLLVLADLAPRTVLQWLASTHGNANVMLYYDARSTFNQAVWTAFFESDAARGKVSMRKLRLREYLVTSLLQPEPGRLASQPEPRGERPHPEVWVRSPDADELELISAELLSRDGEHLHRALDYGPSDLSSPPQGRASELPARREVLLGGTGDQPLGFALVETGPPGINIFSLYDTARLVVWTDEPESRRQVARALISEVAARYRAGGRRSFLVLAGERDALIPDAPSFQAEAMQVVVALSLAPVWFRHLERLWAQR